ncbi:MAG: type II toxin-antitoxin system PemK/MazF family toxin [Sulfurovum sp.]|nr:type II toxin-antitoxin system PemK/MazF family toxin [Sulfurovum sp.]
MVGSIYLAKIYFTDGVKFKLRPILIIKENSFGDFIYIPFTTNPHNKNSMRFTNDFLKNGSFNKESYLIIDKTCTISPHLLDRKIADITEDKLFEIYDVYCGFLKSVKC